MFGIWHSPLYFILYRPSNLQFSSTLGKGESDPSAALDLPVACMAYSNCLLFYVKVLSQMFLLHMKTQNLVCYGPRRPWQVLLSHLH